MIRIISGPFSFYFFEKSNSGESARFEDFNDDSNY